MATTTTGISNFAVLELCARTALPGFKIGGDQMSMPGGDVGAIPIPLSEIDRQPTIARSGRIREAHTQF
jgi:hypothetical protein